jgi:hypothetical protein
MNTWRVTIIQDRVRTVRCIIADTPFKATQIATRTIEPNAEPFALIVKPWRVA